MLTVVDTTAMMIDPAVRFGGMLTLGAMLSLGTSIHAADVPPAVAYVHQESVEEARAPGRPALFTYSVGVEGPVARELEKLASPLPGDKQAYRLYLADAEAVRTLLVKEFQAGNVISTSTMRRPAVRPLKPGQTLGLESYFGAHQPGFDGWALSADNRLLEPKLTGTAAGLHLTCQMDTFRLWANDRRWQSAQCELRNLGKTMIDSELQPGEALIGIFDLGTVGNARRSHVIIFQCLRLTSEQAAVLDGATDAEQWLRVGPAGGRMIADYAVAYREAATQPSIVRDEAAWTQKLSDGTTIRLVSIGLPVRYPFLLWDPDGNPLAQQGIWDAPSRSGPTSGDATTIYCDSISPHPIGEGSGEAKRPDGSVEYRRPGSGGTYGGQHVSGFRVLMGVGPWESAGRVKEGSKLRVGDTTIRVRGVTPNHGELYIVYRQEKPTDGCFTFVAIMKSGKRVWPHMCDAAIRHGPSALALPAGFDRQARIWVGEGKIDYIEVLWRKAETVHFTHYAMEPNERPPFDLSRDFVLHAAAQPTRIATSRPTAAAMDVLASMEQMLASARKGDLPAV